LLIDFDQAAFSVTSGYRTGMCGERLLIIVNRV